MGQNASYAAAQSSSNSNTISKIEENRKIFNEIGENLLISNYRDDEFLEKLTEIIKKPTKAKLRQLESPWREKFNSLSLDENSFIYMHDRLVIPTVLRTPIKNSIHWGTQGRTLCCKKLTNFGGQKYIGILPLWLNYAKAAKKQVRI